MWTRLRELFVPKSADRAVYTSRWARGGAMRAAAGGGVWTRLRELFVPKSADRAVYASRWARGGAIPLWFEGWRRAGPLNRSSPAVRHGRVSPCSVPLQSATPCFGFSVLSDSVEAGGWRLVSQVERSISLVFLFCFKC